MTKRMSDGRMKHHRTRHEATKTILITEEVITTTLNVRHLSDYKSYLDH